MQGLLTFRSLGAAVRAGYQVCERTEDGYLVRMRMRQGWAMALVLLRVSDMPGLP